MALGSLSLVWEHNSFPQNGRKILFLTLGESCPGLFKWAPGLRMEATVPNSLSVLRTGKEAKWGR